MGINITGLVGALDKHPRKVESEGIKKLQIRVLAAQLVPLSQYLSMPDGCGLLNDGILLMEKDDEGGFSLSFRCSVSLQRDTYPGLIKVMPGSRDPSVVRGVILSISLNIPPVEGDGIVFTCPDPEDQVSMKGRGKMDQSTGDEYDKLARSISGANEIMDLSLNNAPDGWQEVLDIFQEILNREG